MKKIVLIITFVVALFLNINILYADNSLTILKGDADGNGVVNSEDALLVLEIIAHLKEMDNTFSIRQCDLTGDYEISADDVLNILKVSAKIIEQDFIEDSDGIYSSVEYKNGYPIAFDDFHTNTTDIPTVSYRLKSADYYGITEVSKCEANASYWKLYWLIEDNIGTDNMELVYSHYVNSLYLPITTTDIPLFFTRTNVSPLGRKSCFMYLDGIPYIYILYLDGKYSYYSGTYKYTGNIPYELSEEYLNKMYVEWRKEQYESMDKPPKKELSFDLYISDKGISIKNAFDSANTARLVIKLKLDPLMAKVGTKFWENFKGTYRFDVQDDDIYIIDLRYDGYNISEDFYLDYSFDVLNESFMGPEVIEVRAYDLEGLEIPVSYTIIHPKSE